jgi:hypothetical protein
MEFSLVFLVVLRNEKSLPLDVVSGFCYRVV